MGERGGRPRADLILVGCVKTQVPAAAPAEEVFVSPLFRCRRNFAERSGRPWFVLSSRHGLVRPDEVIEPYDLCLARQPIAYRRAWGRRVVQQLKAELPGLSGLTGLNGRTVEVHAGAAHLDPIEALLREGGATVVAPLRGLNMGQHLAWYGAATRRA